MRWSWLRMLLLGLMIGPAAMVDAGDAADVPDPDRPAVGAGGHAVRGPNLYVWDEDAREALAWAEEITGARIEPVEGDDLGTVLRALSPLERTWLISSWATSTNERTRQLLARALGAPIEGVGAGWALAHLQLDPSAEVRRLATAAAELRAAQPAKAT